MLSTHKQGKKAALDRRNFIALLSLAAAARRAPATDDFELSEWSLQQLQQGMRSGRFTSQRLVEIYIRRMEQIDTSGPRLNTVIQLNPDASSIAAARDKEKPRGPLHGIPILIKDNLDTDDRMMTTAGSLALAPFSAGHDSDVVAALRAAGAVILGKTNMTEWANSRSSHAVSGWSGRGGQTLNPYVLDRNPGGSSSGSAAAVAANLCAIAVGSETDSSIVAPCSFNSLVGVKPTVGLVSCKGLVPISSSQDTVGPMARSVLDAATLLSVISSRGLDYTRYLDREDLRGARLGVARKFFGHNGRVDKLIEGCLDTMKRLGAQIVDPADLPSHGQFGDCENTVLIYEFKATVNAYLAGRGRSTRVKSIAEVIAFNQREQKREMPWFGQDLLIQSEEAGSLADSKYLDALAVCRRLSRAEGMDAVLAKHKLDAIVAPTTGVAWLTDWANGDQDTGGCSSPAAVAGYPHVTVPAGFVYGLPVGLSFFGAAWSEPTLLKFAYAFEHASKARRVPKFAETADFQGG